MNLIIIIKSYSHNQHIYLINKRKYITLALSEVTLYKDAADECILADKTKRDLHSLSTKRS